METIGEIIPFAKELLNQRPTRSMLKIYMLGSTLAVLGAVGALVETVLLPFVEHDDFEDIPAELIIEEEEEKKERKQVLKSHITLVPTEDVDVLQTAEIKVKSKHLVTARKRSSATRLHAS